MHTASASYLNECKFHDKYGSTDRVGLSYLSNTMPLNLISMRGHATAFNE